MRSSLTGKSVAEFTGTFGIVFFGTGAVCINTQFPGALGLLGIALAFGLVVAVMVSALGHVSGAHFNPAVTAMCLMTKRISPAVAVVYALSQLAGATAAALLLKGTFAAEHWSKVNLGATSLAQGISPVGGLSLEIVLTFFLVLVVFGTAIDGRGHKLGGLAIGAMVTVDILVGGPLTGASMNPARSFGPALAIGHWADQWVYWVGPIAGACLAALIYERLLAPKLAAPPVAAEKTSLAA